MSADTPPGGRFDSSQSTTMAIDTVENSEPIDLITNTQKSMLTGTVPPLPDTDPPRQ